MGIAQAAYEAAVEHVKKRIHSDTNRTLAHLETVQRLVAEMRIAIDTVRCTVMRVALGADNAMVLFNEFKDSDLLDDVIRDNPLFSTFNAGVLGGSQLIFMLAQERNGCPVGTILLLAALAALAGIVVVTFRLEIVAGLVGASIMCFVYAAFMLALLRLRRKQPQIVRSFKTPIFESIQWSSSVALLVMGAFTLFSDAAHSFGCVTGWLLSLVIACMLTLWSCSNTVLETRGAAV